MSFIQTDRLALSCYYLNPRQNAGMASPHDGILGEKNVDLSSFTLKDASTALRGALVLRVNASK
jgi:hypothetical protein